jgi:hypothetical protein
VRNRLDSAWKPFGRNRRPKCGTWMADSAVGVLVGVGSVG